ncbi:hypothetical protein [Anoxybacter fermentans]|uniref:hypothetical protein n=1 Tax=Anoxybacter fermentans TaxID=1323375 RepID=UPI0013DFDAC4|nr:hypothetical protein [Anoxybacter fermentans]
MNNNDKVILKISFDISTCSITYLRQDSWRSKVISRLNDTAYYSKVIKIVL